MKKYFCLLSILLIFSCALFAQEADVASVDGIEELSQGMQETAQTAMSNPDYMVTAGDVYSLSFAAGSTGVSYSILVDTSYKIRVANLGVLDVKDKSFLTVKKEVEDIVTKNYPMSGVQFVLVNPSYFKIKVTGEVYNTKEIKVWSLTRVSDIVSRAGITSYASKRNVIVESLDGKKKVVDLFKAIRYGDYSENPYLRPGDTIHFNRIERRVSISGQVERPGTYELLAGEELSDLISYYGNGLTEFADVSRIEVSKVNTSDSITGKKIYLRAKSLEDSVIQDFVLDCYDSVYIGSVTNVLPVFYIEGAVYTGDGRSLEGSNRLVYRFNPGTNYAFFLRANREMFSGNSDLENAYITRGDEIVPIDITKMLYDVTFYSDLTIEENDILNIPFKQMFVTISGAVKNPGKYPYIPDRTFEYYIALAGGFNKDQNTRDAVEITDLHGNKYDRDSEIYPEYIITAKTNSFSYFFTKYIPIVTTILSLISSFVSLKILMKG